MSLLKKVINAVKRIFKRTSKSPKKRRRTSSGRTKSSKPKKSLSVRKRIRPSARRLKSKKTDRPPKRANSAQLLKPQLKQLKKQPSPNVHIGEVTHYFERIKVCVIRIDKGVIKKGYRLRIEGGKGGLIQTVNSMQIENEDVSCARKGQLIGLKVDSEVYVGDSVSKA